MKKRIYKIFLLTLVTVPFTLPAQDDILKQYIKTGLEHNLALKQEQLNYNKSLAIVKEAKSLFYPELNLNARYSVADGGRMIEIPVGDLMNPVYSTLNEIIQQQKFPQINNEEIPFLRPHEQETKFRLIQPVFNASVYYNHEIKKDLLNAASVNVDIYKRELVSEIKKGYYNFLKASQLVKLLNNTVPLLEENLRVNRSLFKNNKVTNDVVLRSEAEISRIRQQIARAIKQEQLARSYFNFLLNRSFSEEIEISEPELTELPKNNINEISKNAISKREEIRKVDQYKQAAENGLKLNKGSYLPSLTAIVDYGFEGEEYIINGENDFVMASLVFKWDIFNGNQKKALMQQSKIDLEILDNKDEELRRNIQLQVTDAYYDLLASSEAVKAAKDESESNKAAFNIVNKKYKNGQSNYLEFIDARTAMTQSEQNLIIARYDYLTKFAEFERVTAQYKFAK